MNAQVLSHFPMPWLTCIALLLFVTVFAAIVFRTMRPANTALFHKMENLPLTDEGDHNE